MNRPIEKIVIVGGGSAGWLTAAYLQRVFGKNSVRQLKIELVESEDIGVLGVGEATVPSLRFTLQELGIDEQDFMIHTNASFKHAIKFVNWLDDPRERSSYYYHPFDRPRPVEGFDLGHHWLSMNRSRDGWHYADDISIQPALCENLRCPKLPNSKPYEAPVGYAYHMDAILFGRYLRDIAVKRGVERISDLVTQVVTDENGFIRKLKLKSGRELEGDLFIDCSGFRGLLINETLKEPFISYKQTLFCDRAVAIQVPLKQGEKIKPYTTSTAMNEGWVWEIHLSSRRGIGYVYSSDFISDDQAEDVLRSHIGKEADGVNARRIKMRVGRNKNLWVKNCISMGLAGGFIEPLESTGIYLVEMGVKLLAEYFPVNGLNPVLSQSYNGHMNRLYDDLMEFILLHYCTTNREDTEFWKANKHHQFIPDGLRRDLELWKQKPPSPWDKGGSLKLFNHESYLYILAGMNRLKGIPTPLTGRVSKASAQRVFSEIAAVKKKAVELSPDHTAYLATMRAASRN